MINLIAQADSAIMSDNPNTDLNCSESPPKLTQTKLKLKVESNESKNVYCPGNMRTDH